MTTIDTLQAGTTRLRKQFAATVKAEGDSGPVIFTLSTATPDRVQDTINVAGWDLANYRKNPVVLWAHDASAPPVGKSLREWTDASSLNGEVQFASKEYAFAATVEALTRGGYLNAVSVGFSAREWTFDEERMGVNFLAQELLEYSVVPIPANPEALAHAKGAGIELRPLVEWAEKTLDMAGVRDPRVEAAWRASKDAKMFTFSRGLTTITAPSAKGLTTAVKHLGLKMDEVPPEEEPKADEPMDPEEMPKAMACESCGAVYDEGDKFCRSCGEAIKAEEPAAEPEAEEPKMDDEEAEKAILAGIRAGFAG